MAFKQLHYTSCEHGLGGYGGYQFNAVTPGVSPTVLREVEEQTVYEPPRWLTGPGPDELEDYPVAFSHGISEATGAAVTAHVVFTGTDYSGRPGNYFVHALVTDTPEDDFGSVRPAELWGSPLWRTQPAGDTELPELPGPPPRGVIDGLGVQAFLDARGAGADVLPGLLTAVGQAMSGDRPVLVVSHDVTENAWWIAAVSYLLGEQLAHRMTFTTYSHRPEYSRYHLVGILPEALPPDAEASFRTVDFTTGRAPAGEVHPLAAMLASTGVMACPGLWQQATVFAAGTERDLDDWLAPVAVAAGLLGRKLSTGEADAVARWLLGAAGRISPELADVGLGVALAGPDSTLDDERLIDLLTLARGLTAPARAEHLERLLVGRAFRHIARGEPAVTVRLTSPVAETARDMAIDMLDTVPPAMVLAVLEWSAASRALLPDAELERYGRTRLDPATPEQLLAQMAGYYPAILRGLFTRLADEPAEVINKLLSGPIGARIQRDDLAGHPEVAELWLVQSVARGSTQPMAALDEIMDLRAAAGRSPRVDAAVLHRLWPRGCPPDQLAELLGIFADTHPPDVDDWFTAQISAAVVRGATSGGWLALAEALAGHPILALLPEAETRSVRATARILPLLRRADLEGPRGDADVFADLFGEYASADADTRRLLADRLPGLLARARPLGMALRGCPDEVATAFCGQLQDGLAPMRADIRLARRVFITSRNPELAASPALRDRLLDAFEAVRQWNRRDLGALAQSMDNDAELAKAFRQWRKPRRDERARKFLGRAGPPARGT
ncbi:MAG: GTPase-associated protein 1-related protein [Streptosporangiaceae bacterium]